MGVPRVGRVARFAVLLALASAVLLFVGSCTDEGKAKVKAAVSSIAAGGVPTPSQRPTPSGRPSESPTETAAPIPSESSEPTESPVQSPSEIETTEPPTSPPTTEPSPTLSFSPSPVGSSPSETPPGSPTATESAATTASSSTAWIWIVLAVVVVGGIVAWALWARARGQRVAAWRSRARDPFSEGVVLHDRLRAELSAPQMADDRLEEAMNEVDRIAQQLNALTVDAPDDATRQALAGLLMSVGAVRSALDEIRRASGQPTRDAAMEPARARVGEFERSLGSFRAAVWPQSTPEGQAGTAG